MILVPQHYMAHVNRLVVILSDSEESKNGIC